MNDALVYSYLHQMKVKKASDLYITVGFPPVLRIDNDMIDLQEEHLDEEDVDQVITSILTSRQKRDFEAHLELNTALDMGSLGRFRVNVFKQRQSSGLVIRRIISKIPSFEELHLPKLLEKLSMEKRGLVLITGMTGSGKSTTLASMIDYRNQNEKGHIITIEDPIEYYHEHKQSVISQREVGVDTESYATAMKNALRQRPDVILIGEIRDRDVMEQALTMSETGHLCLATIHTNNAYQAIERIVNMFPEEYAQQVRLNLSMNLKAIISQRLLHGKQGGLTPALEIMLNIGLIRELIIKGRYNKITDIIEQNTKDGMCTFDQSLLVLYKQGLIDRDTVIANADKQAEMRMKLQQLELSDDDEALKALDTSVISLSD